MIAQIEVGNFDVHTNPPVARAHALIDAFELNRGAHRRPRSPALVIDEGIETCGKTLRIALP